MSKEEAEIILVAGPVVDESAAAPEHEVLVRDTIVYLGASVISQVFSIAENVVLVWLFVPAQLGAWNLITALVSYGCHLHAGLFNGMNKLVPLLRGRGETIDAARVRNSVFWATMLLSAALAVLTFSASWLVPSGHRLLVRFLAIILPLQLIQLYFFSVLRGDNLIGRMSLGVALYSVLTTVFVVPLVMLSKDRVCGALFGWTGAFVAVDAYFLLFTPYRWRVQLEQHIIGRTLTAGRPLIGIAILDVIMVSLDRWILAFWRGTAAVGYYALALLCANTLTLIASSAGSVVYPRMQEAVGTEEGTDAVRGLLIRPLRALMAIAMIAGAGMMVCMPPVILAAVPKYSPSIPLLYFLVPGAYFVCLTQIAASVLISIDLQGVLLKCQLLLVVALAIADVAVLWRGYEVWTVALTTSAGLAIYGVAICALALCSIPVGNSKQEIANVFFSIASHFLAMLVASWVTILFVAEGSGPYQGVLSAIERGVLIVFLLLPVAWLLNRDLDFRSLRQKNAT